MHEPESDDFVDGNMNNLLARVFIELMALVHVDEETGDTQVVPIEVRAALHLECCLADLLDLHGWKADRFERMHHLFPKS